ncbi:PAS domain S-box protein [Bacillus salacetis]|uniref:PAS domain S-box protein n=1 Tax=Bacillus salacetis TaxID=2315464 RepID=A0A3A1R8L1_9BACI|nr:sigma 54-interacting transcriptional regulator [Bacillus salacetis]RIW38819.1 PAS domain S-box protein [Bacillus salacetis]
MFVNGMQELVYLYENVLDSIDAGVHVINSAGKTIIYNKKMRVIEGMDVEDVLDKTLLEVFEFNYGEESTLLNVLRTGRPALNVKQTYFNVKGSEITTINNTYPVIHEGAIIGAMEIARDITKLEKLIRENRTKKDEPTYTFSHIIGKNLRLKEVLENSRRAAKTTSPVLIVGETGTGKELFAHSIHNSSPRAKNSLINQNCSALPDTVMEELLFGVNKEDSGETIDNPGLFEQAESGTLILDEINSLSPTLQTKLLRVLRERKVRRLGSTVDRPIDCRMVCTINEDPIDAISEGRLKKELYYQLSVVSIFIPPLRERMEDLETLLAFFIEKYNGLFGMAVQGLEDSVYERFKNYEWPGNVRELEHVIEGAFNLMDSGSRISYNQLPVHFRQRTQLSNELELINTAEDFLFDGDREIKPLEDYIAEAETYYIQKALLHHDYNVTKTAKALGMSRQNLQYRIKKFDIERPD